MRFVAVFAALFLSATNVAAQERTLFKGDETGGFGGPVVKFTTVKDRGVVMVGGRGGWIIGHSLVIGGGGYGVVTEVDAPGQVLPGEGPLDLKFGYGGFELEYIVHPNSLGHFGVGTLIGGGDAHFVKDVGPVTRSTQTVGESDAVVVVEPAVNAELNVTPWFRLNAGASYRWVSGIDQAGLKNGDFGGMAATLTLKFGTF